MSTNNLKAESKFRLWLLPVSVIVTLSAGRYALSAAYSSTQAHRDFKILDDTSKTIIVNGYSTSFRWPQLLQTKLDRYFDGKRLLQVKQATKGGTPIAKWIDVNTGEPLQPWLTVLRPRLQEDKGKPVIVLAQQSLQWVFGDRREGIRNAEDKERIQQGADALEKYVKLLKEDGADVVFVAMHIYKHPMEPEIGNERHALDELMRRKIPGVQRGPDVWTPTKQVYPRAFATDGVHPNALGAEVMAQKWFETLLKHDGLEVPTWSKQTKPAQVGQPAPMQRPGIDVLRDLEYVPGGHKRHKLDLYVPEQVGQASDPAKRLPLIIWVHGGAWQAGDKRNCLAARFPQRGYAVASINYRLSQHAIFPAQIEDCKAAVRWLRANAERYNLDPNHFGAWGASAGGHLVALLGTAGDVKEFDKGENLHVSSRVQAVCNYFGPTDFTRMSQFPTRMDHDAADSPESKLIGGPIQQNHDKCQRANPITYLTKDDPPFLIVHGDKDPLVPHNQSQILFEALKKVGVNVKFHTVEGGGHGGFRDPTVEKMVERFFDEHLK
jgi:acetyl esterase/lipase